MNRAQGTGSLHPIVTKTIEDVCAELNSCAYHLLSSARLLVSVQNQTICLNPINVCMLAQQSLSLSSTHPFLLCCVQGGAADFHSTPVAAHVRHAALE